MGKTIVEEFVEDSDNMRLYQQERAIYEVTEKIEAAMEDRYVGRSELAERLGKSKSWVTQLLDGEANKTIRTVADVFAVLGYEMRIFYDPIQISNRRPKVVFSAIETAVWDDQWIPVRAS